MNRSVTIPAALVLGLALAARVGASGKSELPGQLSSEAGLRNATWTASVKDCAGGEVILERDSRRNVAPASILKVFVTAAALELLGADYRAATELYSPGAKDGALQGPLYIKGYGDPSLGSNLVRGAKPLQDVFSLWAAALRGANITSLPAGIAVDETYFEGDQPGSWSWEDIGNYYGARAGALAVGDNLYKLYFKPAAALGAPAELLRTEPPLPGLSFENRVLTGPKGSGDNAYVFAFPRSSAAVLSGTVPQGPEEFEVKGALPDPALHLAGLFSAYLRENGFAVGAGLSRHSVPKTASPLVRTEGAPLIEVVRVANKRSFNLYAELLLKQLAGAKGMPGTVGNGTVILKDYLRANGVDVSEMKLLDASGMSRGNLVQAENFTDLLCSVSRKPFHAGFAETLIYPGDSDATGHVRNLGKGTDLAGKLRIKSGSLSGLRSYTGYLKTARGRTLAFTFILGNYSVPGSGIDKLHEKLLLELAKDY